MTFEVKGEGSSAQFLLISTSAPRGGIFSLVLFILLGSCPYMDCSSWNHPISSDRMYCCCLEALTPSCWTLVTDAALSHIRLFRAFWTTVNNFHFPSLACLFVFFLHNSLDMTLSGIPPRFDRQSPRSLLPLLLPHKTSYVTSRKVCALSLKSRHEQMLPVEFSQTFPHQPPVLVLSC